MCHMSGVMCQVSGVRCHVSRVRCHMSNIFFIFFLQSGGASWWSVCYQRGLPRLVILYLDLYGPLKCLLNIVWLFKTVSAHTVGAILYKYLVQLTNMCDQGE